MDATTDGQGGRSGQIAQANAGGADDLRAFDAISPRTRALRAQLRRVIVGQDEVVELLITALLCQGHVLLVGVPGLAKTLLVRTLARATGLDFHRVQFTPDLMPSDVLGTELIQDEGGHRVLRFVPGPIFTQLLLADEINRTPPKTQAALLEAMAERQVTAGGVTRPLDEPFVVFATQNPIEQEGTYPLPEAQLDRFLFSVWMDYPTREQELEMVAQTPRILGQSVDAVWGRSELLAASRAVLAMPVAGGVVEYAVSLARATRPRDAQASATAKKYVAWGAGPRAGQALVHAAKAKAAMAGLPTPAPAQVREVAQAVLRHRLVPNYAAAGDDLDTGALVKRIIDSVPMP